MNVPDNLFYYIQCFLNHKLQYEKGCYNPHIICHPKVAEWVVNLEHPCIIARKLTLTLMPRCECLGFEKTLETNFNKPNIPTNIVDVRGSDPNIFLI